MKFVDDDNQQSLLLLHREPFFIQFPLFGSLSLLFPAKSVHLVHSNLSERWDHFFAANGGDN